MIDIVSTLRAARTLADFVEGGPLAKALADINMQAALDALDKATSSRNPEAHVWSAVNHLESAQAALHQAVVSNRATMYWVRFMRLMELDARHDRVLCLMGICYRYLGDDELARRAFARTRDKAMYFPKNKVGQAAYAVTWGAAVGLNPLNMVEGRKANRMKIDAAAVERAAFMLPPRATPPRLPS